MFVKFDKFIEAFQCILRYERSNKMVSGQKTAGIKSLRPPKTSTINTAAFLCLLFAFGELLIQYELRCCYRFELDELLLMLLIPQTAAFFTALAFFNYRMSVTAKSNYVIGFLFVSWIWIVQPIHFLMGESVGSHPLYGSLFLIALPFASVLHDPDRQKGLKIVAVPCFAFSVLLSALSVLASAQLLVPPLSNYIYFDGPRLWATTWPTISANMFMLGIGFALYLGFCTKKLLLKILFGLGAALTFVALSMTNCRTVILLTSLIFAGALLIVLLPRIKAGKLIRILFSAGILAAGVIGAWKLSRLFYFTNDKGIPSSVGQGPGLSDIWTLNNRTNIWMATLRVVFKNPGILLHGTENCKAILSAELGAEVGGTHNSWLQTLMYSGVFGLFIVLIVTYIALRSICIILTKRGTAVPNGIKIIALLTLVEMGDAFTDAILFVNGTWPSCFVFLLCVGYLREFCASELREAKCVGNSDAALLSRIESGSTVSLAKRAFDVLISAALLIVLLPLIIPVIILIFIEDPTACPISRTECTGTGGKRFLLYRMRSTYGNPYVAKEMPDEMAEDAAPQNITCIGCVLRRLNADRILMLINVIKGNINLGDGAFRA